MRAYWKPEDVGLMPALQVGYDIRNIDDADNTAGAVEATASWMIGAIWDDAFVDGNRAGLAFGQRAYATEVHNSSESVDDDADDNFVWEAYYDYKVSDSITVTPALFGGSNTETGTDDDIFGALVQTTFRL